MKRILGLLLAGMVLTGASCEGSRPPEQTREPSTLELTTIVQRSIPGGRGGTVRLLIRDQATLDAIWKEFELPDAPPSVDFGQEMVIAAAMETQSCVSKVTIRSAAEAEGELVVGLLEAPPAPNCVCITAERPVHIVRLRKVDAGARFDVEQGRTDC